MRARNLVAITMVLLLAALPRSTVPARAALASPTVNCAAVIATLHPGLNPGPQHPVPFVGGASDAPKGPFTVSLPVYPGAIPLHPFVGSPFPEYQESPYLQTAGLEYTVPSSFPNLESWFTRAFHACGYLSDGNWNGDEGPFSDGLTFESRSNSNLTVEMSFGATPPRGSYIAYGVEEVILPTRPARSYLHGPFVALKMAVQHNTHTYPSHSTVVHQDVGDRAAIRHLVSAINSITAYQTVISFCHPGVGPPPPIQPVWLSFIRPNGTVVHAFADGSGGACGGGFAANGARWLIFGVRAWNQVLALVTGGRG